MLTLQTEEKTQRINYCTAFLSDVSSQTSQLVISSSFVICLLYLKLHYYTLLILLNTRGEIYIEDCLVIVSKHDFVL